LNGRKKFFILLGTILIASAGYYFATTNRSSDYVIIGTVDAYQVVVSPKIMGRIEKLNVDDGTAVKAGDLIAVLDSDELRAEQAAYAASLKGTHHRIAEMTATYQLTKGETSSTVEQAEAQVANTQAQLDAARANLQRSQQNYDRIMPLFKNGIAAKQDADNAEADLIWQKANVAAAVKAIDAARANLAVAQARTHQTTAADRTIAESRAQAENAKFQLNQVNTRLGYTTVLAPINGIVTTRVARQGEVVNAGSPIVTLVDLDDSWVYADAPETQAVNIALGDEFKIRLPNGKTTTGRVTFKNAEAEFATQRDVGKTKRDIKTIALKLAVDNRDHTLAPGMTAEVLVPNSKQASLQGTGR
jgi:HlyD family secretion protein